VVYALGSNGSGQLGVGHAEDVVGQPQRCIFQRRSWHQDHDDGREPRVTDVTSGQVDKMVAGGNHTLLLTTDGRLFTAGRHGFGYVTSSLEFHEQTHNFYPAMYGDGDDEGWETKGTITDVAATWEASFVVVDDRLVYACGAGHKGEVGLGPDVTSSAGLKEVFDISLEDREDFYAAGPPVKIIAIAASMAHVVVLLSSGHVFGWGSCRKGQLGEKVKPNQILWRPTRIDGDIPIKPERVVAGKDYTIFFAQGQPPVICGDIKGTCNSQDLDRHLQSDVHTVVSGWSSVHLFSSPSGPTAAAAAVKSLGKNNHGQLAPAGLPPILFLAAGSEHCVALLADGEVVAWGWGEHGNCGQPLDDRGNVVDRWNVIPLPAPFGRVTKVAAGCATSFLICDEDD
jgi:protein ATS1